MFSSSSHNAPIKFQMGPKYSQHVTYVPIVFFNMFPIAPHFVPYALPNYGPLGTYISKQSIKTFTFLCLCLEWIQYLGVSKVSELFFGDGVIKSRLIAKTRCVWYCGLAIYIKNNLKAKEELWKVNYFTMQKNNLPKIH